MREGTALGDPKDGGSDDSSTDSRATIGFAANLVTIVVGALTAISLLISIITTALQQWLIVVLVSVLTIILIFCIKLARVRASREKQAAKNAANEGRSEGSELIQRFAADLRELRIAAGRPTYDRLGRLAGCSKSTVHQAVAGARLPSLDTTLGLVRALGGNEKQWRERWTATRQALDEQRSSSGEADLSGKRERPEKSEAYRRSRRVVVISLSLLVTVAAVAGGFLTRAVFFSPEPLDARQLPQSSSQLCGSAISDDYGGHADFYQQGIYFDLIDDRADGRSAVLQYKLDNGQVITVWNLKGITEHKRLCVPTGHTLVEYRVCNGEYHQAPPENCGKWIMVES